MRSSSGIDWLVSAESYEPKHGYAALDYRELVGDPLHVAGDDAMILLEPRDQRVECAFFSRHRSAPAGSLRSPAASGRGQ